MLKIIVVSIFMLALCLFVTPNAVADNPLASFPRARVIRSHNNQGAVVFWDATPFIERFANLQTPRNRAIALLNYEAFKIFQSEAKRLPSSDRHLTVVAAYAKTGALDAHYQTSSFEGVQNILTLDGNVHKGMTFGKDADRRAQLGVMPAGLKLQLSSQILNEEH